MTKVRRNNENEPWLPAFTIQWDDMTGRNISEETAKDLLIELHGALFGRGGRDYPVGTEVIMVDDHFFTDHARDGDIGVIFKPGFVDWGRGPVRTDYSRIELYHRDRNDP